MALILVEDLRVPKEIAMKPRPKPPDNINPKSWENYCHDLACWKAMRADVLKYGIKE